jgi:FR47-like protein
MSTKKSIQLIKMIISASTTDQDLRGILALQQQNLPKNISETELLEQGFVTVEHDFEILEAMNRYEPHVIARDESGGVVAYALFMHPDFGAKVPILVPMFELLKTLHFQQKSIDNLAYFVIGQICVGKSMRGRGVFSALYADMNRRFSSKYDIVITEIATRNTRSIRAHEKIGFEIIHIFTAPDGEEWAIVAWDFRMRN